MISSGSGSRHGARDKRVGDHMVFAFSPGGVEYKSAEFFFKSLNPGIIHHIECLGIQD